MGRRLTEVFLHSKQYQQKQLNDTLEIDVSGDYVNVPKNKMLSIRKIEPQSISNKKIDDNQRNSFWSSKKKFERHNHISLSGQSRPGLSAENEETPPAKAGGNRRNKDSVILEYKSSKILRPENQAANDSMEAIELITEIKRQKTISSKAHQQINTIGDRNREIKRDDKASKKSSVKKRKFASRLFPILDNNPVNEHNLQKSMKILQKNQKSSWSISNCDQLESPRYENILETKSQRSSSPYENIVKHFETSNNPRPNAQKFIAFILHGLEGNPFDMRHIRAALINAVPNCSVYIINNNFNLTNQDLNLQARRLALEVKEILNFNNYFGRSRVLTEAEKSEEIIMIGHSLGGLIIRESVEYMPWIQDKLFALVTLNTPHLGCLGKRFLVNTGCP